MMQEQRDIFIVDNDGVLRRESQQLDGVPELFAQLHADQIRSVLLSNNARKPSSALTDMLRTFGVADDHLPDVLGSAEATALYLKEHTTQDSRVFVCGAEGLKHELKELDVHMANNDWDGQSWKQRPTHVAAGFDTENIGYWDLALAYNAIRNGAEFIATNPDLEYRNAAGEVLPANGANLNYLSGAGVRPHVIGKPNKDIAELALGRMNATHRSDRITVVGDSVDQDLVLGEKLRAEGWNVRNWIVLSGISELHDAQKAQADAVFDDIVHIRKHLKEGLSPTWSFDS